MRSTALVSAVLACGLLAAPDPVAAQGRQAPGAAAEAAETPRAARRTKREPTAGQMAARERQKRCGAEWKDAKAKGATAGLKWPAFWSRCNARLKGNSA